MWGKIAAAVVCMLLLAMAVMSFCTNVNYYNANAKPDIAVQTLASPAVVQRAEIYSEWIRTQDLASLKRETDASILNDSFYKAVPAIAKLATAEKPLAVRVVGYHINTTASTSGGGTWTDTNVLIGHYYPWGVIFTTTTFHDQNNISKVSGFYLRRLSNAEIASLKFSLAGKSQIHYAVLALAGVILVFSLFTLYVSLTRPALKLRWLWVIFVALGIGRFAFNWETSNISFYLLNFHAPQVDLEEMIAQYPVVDFWLPIGALLFWPLARSKAVADKKPVAHSEH